MARSRFRIFKDQDLPQKILQAHYPAVSFRKDKGLIFGLASLPTSEEQLRGSVHIVDDVRGIGALHIEVDLLLLKELYELNRRGSDNDLAFHVRRSGELARDVMHEVAKMLFDLLLMCCRDD